MHDDDTKKIRHDDARLGRTDGLHPSIKDKLRYFAYDHLPPHLAAVSQPFHRLAHYIASDLRLEGAQATIALQKLKEAKDEAVCAALDRSKDELRAAHNEAIARERAVILEQHDMRVAPHTLCVMQCTGSVDDPASGPENKLITFEARYTDENGNRVNESFSKWTPSAQLRMQVTNPTALAMLTEHAWYDVLIVRRPGPRG